MELPQFRRKAISGTKILGLPGDIIRIIFNYLHGKDLENLFIVYPKLKENFEVQFQDKIKIDKERINYPKYYKLNKYIVEGEDKNKCDKFIENVYNNKYPSLINSWKALILRLYDEIGLNRNRKLLSLFLRSLDDIKEGDIINLNFKEEFSYFYVHKLDNKLTMVRIYCKNIDELNKINKITTNLNINIFALPSVTITYLAKNKIQFLSQLKDFYPFLPTLKGFLYHYKLNEYNTPYWWDICEHINFIILGDEYRYDNYFYPKTKYKDKFYIRDTLTI
jgi:hypothetical protein